MAMKIQPAYNPKLADDEKYVVAFDYGKAYACQTKDQTGLTRDSVQWAETVELNVRGFG